MKTTDSLEQAKQRLPLPQLMVTLGLGGHTGKSGRCPFHEDSSASFSVYTGNDGVIRWKCFAGCGQGDAIAFLAKHRGFSNTEACREYIRLAGISSTPEPSRGSAPLQSMQPAFEWQPCVTALTPEHRAELASWRGYTLEFVEWLHAQSLIGMLGDGCFAFPVHDPQGCVLGCHHRVERDGSWRYHPKRTRTAPLVIGALKTAKTIYAFESQWDLLAVLDRMRHHSSPLPDTAAIATRGAGNARSLEGLCDPDAMVFAFGQNDPAGQRWLKDVAAGCGCRTFQVVTPPQHKDANDWTRAGVTGQQLSEALCAAEPVTTNQSIGDTTRSINGVPNPTIEFGDDVATSGIAPFPLDALPPRMAEIVEAVSKTERVPVALPAVVAIGFVSAALGAGLEVVSGKNRRTRGNLYLLASAESGSGKSETFRIIGAPLLDHQTRMLEIWRQKTSPELQSEIRVIDKEIATLERKAAKSFDPTDRELLRGELEYKIARKDELTARAAMPCIVTQDVTTERLAVLLHDNREVVFSGSADARKLVDNLLGRYNPGKTTDESLYLSAYSGDFVRVDRQGRSTIVLNRPCLTLCWLIQPDLLATMLDVNSLSASGFLPRLLVCHTNATPRRIEGESEVLSESQRDQWTQLLGDLLGKYHDAGKPHLITPTPEALGVLNAFHNCIVDRRAVDLADVGAFAARYAENAWRLAVVLHAAQWASDADSQPLTTETATNAVRVAEWFIASQLDILARGRQAAATKVQDEVLELLETNRQRKALDFITARDVHRARIVNTAEAAKELLAGMEADGLLVGQNITPAQGGKTTRIFRRIQNPVSE